MNAKRAAAFMRTLADKIDPPRRSMADECEVMRRELEAEARAEFGLRNVEFRGCVGSAHDELASRKPALGSASEASAGSRETLARRQSPTYSPDPASPGDVWPRQAKVTPLTRKLRGVR